MEFCFLLASCLHGQVSTKCCRDSVEVTGYLKSLSLPEHLSVSLIWRGKVVRSFIPILAMCMWFFGEYCVVSLLFEAVLASLVQRFWQQLGG